jgi:hypothetical protein
MAGRPEPPPVPKPVLVPPTLRALMAILALLAVGALTAPVCGCVANFWWEAGALGLLGVIALVMITGACRRCWHRVVH